MTDNADDKRFFNMALNDDGDPLSHAPEEVQRMCDALLMDPTTTMVLMLVRKGDELMGIMGEPPSEEALLALQSGAASYERVLRKTKRGHA